MFSSSSFTSAISVCLANPEPFLAVYPWMEMLCREQTPGFGKTIFPKMDFKISGLDGDKRYEISLSFERFGSDKYTYDKEWKVKGEPEEEHEYKRISKGMETGSTWMETPFSVPEARITNVPGNKKENTFYLTPLHKYVPVVFIRDVEAGGEMRFAVELAQFLPTTKRYNTTLSSSNARTNPNSTVRNNGPGKPVKKRKTEEDGTAAPKAKRTPLQEKHVQSSHSDARNFPTPPPSTVTSHSAYPNQHFLSQFHYQSAMGYNHFHPSTNNFGNHSAPFDFSANFPSYSYPPQFNNYPQYPYPPMPNFAPAHTHSLMPLYPTPSGSPDTFYPQVQNENFAQFPIPPIHFTGFPY